MPMPTISVSVRSLASWRTVALVFALLNLKALPLAWHCRLFYRMLSSWYTEARVKRLVASSSSSTSTSSATATHHPIFEPVSIFSRAPLLETDYNLHKSNSTYFSDLDESRTALMTRVLIPGLRHGSRALEREGHKGRLAVILGSVHTSFHREILPYERYEVRSRLLGWDRKWIVVGSWFVRPARNHKHKEKGNGKEEEPEVLLASALSKYVVKKGRFTVSPERCFTAAGWLSPGDHDCDHALHVQSSDAQTTEHRSDHLDNVPVSEGIPAAVPEAAADVTTEVVEKLETAAEALSQSQSPPAGPLDSHTTPAPTGNWDWHRIDAERLRGLNVAANWLALDKELLDEFLRG
ncbi:hypothetical protein A1O3_00563 [Capronia epimyces CBS 606.96]|uniref:Thioesterase n=1 Tax=Capronia epimyces CBS 606.96 TaxID=1182542 RepID=W9YHJ2_9EURO|nr:uncharacterized protein A1O3_00563 [Capronia epimyces CBS 606.96]EXJ92013.1 hypothetical protein A1O3_00563 [Capronia epimyces CBS 606.96]